MGPTSVDSVLHEARTLAIYASRSGTLPEHSRIFDEIESMTQARERGEHPPLAPLIAETQKVSKAAGVTINQLIERETPLGRLRRGAALTTPFVIGLLTLLLTLYLAFQSSELHKADLAVRENQDLVAERLQEKIYLAWKMYRYENVLSAKGPPLAQLDSYQKLVDDAKRLSYKRAAVQSLLLDSAIVRYVPALFQFHGPCWLQNFARMLNSDISPACQPVLPETDSGAVVPKKDGDDKLDIRKCLNPHSPLAPNVTPATIESKLDLDDYKHDVDCFLQSLQIGDYDYPMDAMIYATRNKVHLLVSWLLPGLYGLLGACVFVMRDLLRDKGQGKARVDARIVDLLSLLLRVSLGGLSGIIIGWFSVPTSLTANSSAISISSIPFGMAFLAGFSIESLFAVLDRLPKAIAQRDEKKSAEAAKEFEGKA